MNRFISLNENYLFRRVFYRGKFITQKDIVVYALRRRYNETEQGVIRVAVSVGKKVGGAVQRNRVKRIIKSALYNAYGLNRFSGCDLIIVGKPNAIDKKSYQIQSELETALNMLSRKMTYTGRIFKNEKNRSFYDKRV